MVVLITGASKGIGRKLAVDLAVAGHSLGLVARTKGALTDLKKEIGLVGGARVVVFAGDVGSEAFAEKTVGGMIAEFGRIDVVVNNAGFGVFGAAEGISVESWDAVFATNVKGTFLFSKLAIPHMKLNGGGHIINIASDVAKRVFDGGSLYCASKYAQDAFSMALRKEVRKFGIKVSVVYSGLVDTYFHARPQGDEHHADWLKDEDMSNAIQYVMNAPKHVVIDELMIHPMSQDY
jgi:NADP-dependent 3-hydroxy acid dehydrogenase YdfG